MNPIVEQKSYNIEIDMEYFNPISKKLETVKIDHQSIAKYEVRKDAINYNYNLHLLKLNSIINQIYDLLMLKKTRLTINIIENSKVISKTRFIVLEADKFNSEDNMSNIDLLLMSEMTYDFVHYNRFSNITKDEDYITSYQLMSNIFKEINKKFGSDIQTHYNDSGIVSQLHESLRLQGNLKDIEVFDYIFKEFPPYLLNPYFILDDFHLKAESPYNIFIFNLSNVGGNYQLKDTAKIENYDRSVTFIDSKPMIDNVTVDYMLRSTLVLINKHNNSKGILEPADPEFKSPEVITHETSLDVKNFKNKLYLSKKLSDYKATYEKYIFNRINIDDIAFGNLYNITARGIHDHLPLSIEYTFLKNKSDLFNLTVAAEFSRVPTDMV